MNENDKQAEPVAWMDEFGNVFPLGAQRGPKYLNESMKPLYTHPAQPVQPAGAQEPRYWVHNFGDEDGGEEFFDHPTGSDCPDCVPLYLAPQATEPAPLVRLTEHQLEQLGCSYAEDFDFANAIMDAMIKKNGE